MNAPGNDHSLKPESSNPTGSKRGRHRTKNLPPPDDMEWAPGAEKRPVKSTTKKQNKQYHHQQQQQVY